jgi:hypothetical protein
MPKHKTRKPKYIPWNRAFDDLIEKPPDKVKGYIRPLQSISSLVKGPITLALPDHQDIVSLAFFTHTINFYEEIVDQQKEYTDHWHRHHRVLSIRLFTDRITNDQLLQLIQTIGYSSQYIKRTVVHKQPGGEGDCARNERESRAMRMDMVAEWWKRSWLIWCPTCEQWSEECVPKDWCATCQQWAKKCNHREECHLVAMMPACVNVS